MAGPLEVQNDKSAGAPAVMRGSEGHKFGSEGHKFGSAFPE